MKNKEAGEELESAKVKEENTQLSFDQDENKPEEEGGRKVDWKQFSWCGIISLIVLLFMILLLLKKQKLT